MLIDLVHPFDVHPHIHDPAFDGFFALSVLKTVALVVVVGFALIKCHPWRTIRYYDGGRPTYYGFMWGLHFLAARSLLTVIALGRFAATTPTSAYVGIPGLIGVAFGGLARAMLAYTMIRTSLHAARAAGIVRGDTILALMTPLVLSLATISRLSMQARFEVLYINDSHGKKDIPLFNEWATVAMAMTTADNALTVIGGLVGLGSAIYGQRKSAQLNIVPDLKRAMQRMTVVALVWVGAGLAKTITSGTMIASFVPVTSTSRNVLPQYGVALASNAVELLSEVAISILFALCFRPAKNVLLSNKSMED